MLELGISQAQSQFTKLLTQTTIIVDKKINYKKAVLMPYEKYLELVAKSRTKESLEQGVFSEFVGILDNEFICEDEKYKKIIK